MTLTRRKFVVTGLAAGVVGSAGALIATGEMKPGFVWRGAALGGEARVSLYGADPAAAQSALEAIAAEIERLEDIFSLHRATSEISRLNREGSIALPSRDFVESLRVALEWRNRTHGAFDPTVQPVWQAAASSMPISSQLLALTGSQIEISQARISLSPGASVTLNGIAQGRIADRVTDILLAHGFSDVVIDAGELRLPGSTRRAVGIPAAKAAVSVAGVAIATSEPSTLMFDARTFRHHLIDPRSGESPRHWHSISVFAPTAEMADALSTAFAVLPYEAVADLVGTVGDLAVIGSDRSDRIRSMGDLRLAGTPGSTQ
jgi:thiamine biosynthesis lipoprotein